MGSAVEISGYQSGRTVLWNNVSLRSAIVVFVAFTLCGLAAGQAVDHSPQLLLTPQRLKRLQRDRERQTVRWVAFENRVESVPDSPERGFELALYYAVTHDEKKGREGVEWAGAHPRERRQTALIVDWCGTLLSDDERAKLTPVEHQGTSISNQLRDELFTTVARGENADSYTAQGNLVLKRLQEGGFTNASELYAAVEYLDIVRTTLHTDLRQNAPQFFFGLPTEFLLSLKPEQVEHPDWMTHAAALALVGLDPNLAGSQYLQGWAIENRQMLREGPGVAYEFLWGDPYLPGVGYQNLDPWVYDSNGRLFARSNWDPDSCWISISTSGVAEENCPAGWRAASSVFGHMTLTPMTQPCTVAPHRPTNEVVILWKLRPHQSLSFTENKKQVPAEADAAGMWRLPGNVEGKVCVGR